MNLVFRGIRAEGLKLKNTLALRMAVIAPGLVVALMSLQLMVMDHSKRTPAPAEQAWLTYAEGVIGLWTFLMLPLYITLQASLLAGLEHQNRQWKYLFALPIPRHSHFTSKALVLMLMVLLATLSLIVLIPFGGWLLGAVQPNAGLTGWPPLWAIAKPALATVPACLLMAMIQTSVALRWSSFTVAVSTGMSATVAGFLIGQSERFGHWYPWSMPLWTMAGDARFLPLVLASSLGLGLLALALGAWLFSRRDPES